MQFTQKPTPIKFSLLSLDSLFHRRSAQQQLYCKTGHKTYVDDSVPDPEPRTMRGDPRLFYHVEHPLPGLDMLNWAWEQGHEQWVVERSSTWQAVLLGVRIAEEHGGQAARMLADLVQEHEQPRSWHYSRSSIAWASSPEWRAGDSMSSP